MNKTLSIPLAAICTMLIIYCNIKYNNPTALKLQVQELESELDSLKIEMVSRDYEIMKHISYLYGDTCMGIVIGNDHYKIQLKKQP